MKISVRHRYVEKIPVLEVVSESAKTQPLPLIVYYHGWQSAKELSLTQARKLAAKGFRVVLPDAMNHGERKTGAVSMIPSITFWSSIQYNVIEFSVILRFFQRLGLVEGNKVGVGGVSMGGITTCALLTQHPEIQAAVCLMGTPYPGRYIQRVMRKAKEMDVYVPEDLPLLLSWVGNYDLSRMPEKLQSRPILFWHGTEDVKIPYEDMTDFQALVKTQPFAAGSRFLTGTGEGHLVQGSLMDTVAEFLAESLK
ncbi:alpha/beta fold hydrolase [Enterococcus sp. LJL128]|uniref:alpha/beta fold hydrolase n=1 Tax=Enterococcus sp. LJL51 TaxID=3416656 RepID=UPI003CF87AE8